MLSKTHTRRLWSSCAALAVSSIHSAASAQTTYEYDSLGRLTEVTYNDGSNIVYNRDNLDNRTSVVTSEPAPSFSVDDITVTEGSPAVFTITKTGTTSQSYSVDYGTADQSATAGSDYTAQSNTLTFSATDVTRTVTVPTTDDSSQESTETFALNLSNVTGGASITDSQGVGIIEDNDTSTAVSFSINDVSENEGDPLVFTVTKSGNDGLTHSVDYDASNGTATNSDYTKVSGTLTFTPSETSKTVTVTTSEDFNEESDETMKMDLDSPSTGATITDAQGIGTILNDDGAGSPIQFSVNDVSATEGDDLQFIVTKTGSDGLSYTVDYDPKNGTATNSDYDGSIGSVTFSPSQTSATVSIATTQDTKVEGSETIILELEGVSGGAGISDSEGVGTIIDDD